MDRTVRMVLPLTAVLCGWAILAGPRPMVYAAAAAAAPVATADSTAKQILDSAGVQGGLIVHLGCGDGRLTAALRVDDRYLVHGLEADATLLAAARKHIQSLGLYGKVSVAECNGQHLPYADNLVNLLVAEQLGGVTLDEVQRVLAPLGVALIREGGRWKKIVKPQAADTDEWTHFLHDASGNAVAKDRVVGPPKRLQWEAEPRWCRSHEFPSSVNAVVTAKGRLFAILDEGPIGVYEKLPQRCSLVARDAANGLLLWKQPMRQWSYEYGTGLGDRWHIHHTLPRRLVADGDRVYVTLSFQDSPVSVLDAATGAMLTEALEGTKGTDEMLCNGGVLVVKIADESPGATQLIARKDLHGALAAVDIRHGKLLWRKENTPVAPYAMALQDNRLVYHNLAEIVCLDAKTGQPLWRVANDAGRIPGAATTLVLSDGVVLHHCYRQELQAAAGKKNAGKKDAARTPPARRPPLSRN